MIGWRTVGAYLRYMMPFAGLVERDTIAQGPPLHRALFQERGDTMSTDYKPIRIAYICGRCNSDGKHIYPTLSELAQEHGLSLSTLTHKAAEEGWTDERKRAERRITAEAISRYESELTRLLARIDFQAAQAATIMLDTIVETLEKAETIHERQALTVKYAKLLPDILAAGHEAVGVGQMSEQTRDRLEDLQHQIDQRPAERDQRPESEAA